MPLSAFEQQHPSYPSIRLLDKASQRSAARDRERGLSGEYSLKGLRVGERRQKKKPKPKNKNHNSSKNDLCSELSEPTNASGRMFVHPHIHTHLTHTHIHLCTYKHTTSIGEYFGLQVTGNVRRYAGLPRCSEASLAPGSCFSALWPLASALSSHC